MTSPQFEDFETTKAFEILQRQRDKLLCCECCAALRCAAPLLLPLFAVLLLRRVQNGAGCCIKQAASACLNCPHHAVNDDIQGTGAVVTSGFVNGMK